MNVSDKIIQLAKENNGVVTTAVISEKGILRGNLKKLVDEGRLEKTARGVYILPEIWEDEFGKLLNFSCSSAGIPCNHQQYGG